MICTIMREKWIGRKMKTQICIEEGNFNRDAEICLSNYC